VLKRQAIRAAIVAGLAFAVALAVCFVRIAWTAPSARTAAIAALQRERSRPLAPEPPAPANPCDALDAELVNLEAEMVPGNLLERVDRQMVRTLKAWSRAARAGKHRALPRSRLAVRVGACGAERTRRPCREYPEVRMMTRRRGTAPLPAGWVKYVPWTCVLVREQKFVLTTECDWLTSRMVVPVRSSFHNHEEVTFTLDFVDKERRIAVYRYESGPAIPDREDA
jgi:hypothetical protein